MVQSHSFNSLILVLNFLEPKGMIYIEVDKFWEKLVKHPEKSLPSLLVTINGSFSKLEASIGHFHTVCQSDSSVDGSYSFPLMFEKFPEVNQEGSQWTDCEIRDAINLIYENLHKLDSYLNVITLEGLISQEKFEKSRAYSLDKSHFHFVHEFVTILMDSAILFFGGIALVVEDIRRLPCVHGSQSKE